MDIWGFILGTGIMWILSAVVVTPLARAFTKSGRKTPQASTESGQITFDGEEITTECFILAHVVVLTVAGLLLGLLLGWFFIGITWRGRNWPGLIAFIVASMVGSAMHG
jgi:hypothetical protein